MTVDDLGQFEHRYLILAEQLLQFVVSIDVASIGWILKIVLLDVFPDLLGHFRAGKGFGPDDR